MFIFCRTFFIIGGNVKQRRFRNLQRSINQLIDGDKDVIDDEASPYYQQLFDSIKYIDVCFNTELELEECTASQVDLARP